MRWGLGLTAMAVAMLCWVGTMLAYPYTTWGSEHEHVRPSVAEIGIQFAAAVLAFVAAAALVVFTDEDNRRGWKAIAFTAMLTFLGATALVRLVWLEFVVLA